MLDISAQSQAQAIEAPLSIEERERERLMKEAQRFKARVVPIPDPLRPDGSLWVGFPNPKSHSPTAPMRTEEAAWDALLEKMALTKPGRVVLRSHEFAETLVGRLPVMTHRQYVPLTRSTRVELREMAPNHFEIFEVSSLHSLGPARDADSPLVPRDPIDCHQFRHGTPDGPYVFAEQAQARDFIGAYIEQREIAHRKTFEAPEPAPSVSRAQRTDDSRSR